MPTASDIIEGDEVEIMVNEVRPQSYIFRRAFRNHDATGANSSSIEFDELDLDLDPSEIYEVPEDASLPRASFNQDQFTAAYTDYGFEVPITDKAIEDSKLDVRAQTIEQMAEVEERRMDSIAGNVLANNVNDTTIDNSDDSSGTLEYMDFVEARQTALDLGYNIGRLEVYAPATSMTQFLGMEEFNRASELGDYVVQNANLPDGNLEQPQAFLGMIADMPVYLSNVANALGDGQALVVDTGQYGYESVRDPFSVDVYREEQEQRDVYRAFGRYDWVATDSDGALMIDS